LCSKIDVLIDFSAASQVPVIAEACAQGGCALVSGTTGLEAKETQALATASCKIPVLHAMNFSFGIQVMAHLIERAAFLLHDEADVEILEKHHRFKADAPSGTALFLGEVLAQAMGTSLQKCAIWPRLPYRDEPRTSGKIHFSCQRGGGVVGTHRIDFFCPEEVVSLEHQALDGRVFARGALKAALWIRLRPPKMYTMKDIIVDYGL
jgi:4-hydroxy-tetrahydrodipicolinate reductase